MRLISGGWVSNEEGKRAYPEAHAASFRIKELDLVEGRQSVDVTGESHRREVVDVIGARARPT